MFIPDATTATKEEGEKIFLFAIFLIHKYHNIVNNFFRKGKKNQKFVIKLTKIWVWYTGNLGQKSTGFRIRIRNIDTNIFLRLIVLSEKTRRW